MPLYEYTCARCGNRFSHLARSYDEPAPPCPACGSRDVERAISRVSLGRSDAQREADYEARSHEVDPTAPQEVARFLKQAGHVAEKRAPVDRDVFREIVDRRAEGAGDRDLQDEVDAIPFGRQTFHPDGHAGHEHGEHDDASSGEERRSEGGEQGPGAVEGQAGA